MSLFVPLLLACRSASPPELACDVQPVVKTTPTSGRGRTTPWLTDGERLVVPDGAGFEVFTLQGDAWVTAGVWHELPAQPRNVALAGDLVVVQGEPTTPVGDRLFVVDVSDPAAPATTAEVPGVDGLHLLGGDGLVAVWRLDGTVHVLDLTDAESPEWIAELTSSLDLGLLNADHHPVCAAGRRVVAVFGEYSTNAEIVVLDATTPGAPVLTQGALDATVDGLLLGVVCDAERTAVAVWNSPYTGGIPVPSTAIVDLQLLPGGGAVAADSMMLDGTWSLLLAADGLGAVTSDENELGILDLDAMLLRGTVPPGDRPDGVLRWRHPDPFHLDAETLWWVGQDEVLRADAREPVTVLPSLSLPLPEPGRGPATDVQLAGELTVVDDTSVLRVFRGTEPVGTASEPAPDLDSLIAGDGWIAHTNRLQSLVVRSPEPDLTQLAEHPVYVAGARVAGGGALALVDTWPLDASEDGYGVEIVDLSDPSRPETAGHLLVRRVLTTDGRFALGLSDGELWAFDLADPAAPVDLGRLVVGEADDLRAAAAIAGDRAWVITNGQLLTLDLGSGGILLRSSISVEASADPSASSYQTLRPDLDVVDDRLVLVDGGFTLRLFDVAGSSPLLVEEVETPAGLRAVAFDGTTTALAGGAEVLLTVDVSCP